MKITIEKLVNARQSLQVLSQVEMPIKTAYGIARLLEEVNTELITYEKKKKELVDKYAEKDKDGNLKQEGEFWKELNAKHQELLELVVEINAKPIDISQVTADIKPSSLIMLKDFIKVEGDKSLKSNRQ